MDTKDYKEAIKFLEKLLNKYEFGECNWNEGITSAIKLIKYLEKYEKMWKELEGFIESGKIVEVPEEYLSKEGGVLQYIIETIKQKYFPKPIKKTITIGIEAKNESQYNWFRNYLLDAEKLNVQDGYIKISFEKEG